MGTVRNTGVANSSTTALTLLRLLVVSVGVASISVAVTNRVLAPGQGWLIMVALALAFSPLGAIKIPGVRAHVSLGDMVSFTCAALFGPSAAVIAAAADGTAISLRVTKTLSKFSYNVASNSISMAVAGVVTKAVFPSFGDPSAQRPAAEMAAALGLLALSYFIASTFLISAYLSLSRGVAFLNLWKENSLWTSISFVASGASAFVAFLLVGQVGYYVLLVVLGVMVLVSLFYRTYFQRVESANQRAERSEELNFKTVETLIATMGAVGYAVKMNVRRVERLALELAERAGCSQGDIAALRVAALLHDVGNIVVPAQILEKPGELTPAEFEKVRTHAEMGARIVESMGFPSAAADIVRHHHERFDGSGYPDGLDGQDIPLAARILAIVDCYNALTVDRPHRQKVSRREALEIMKRSSGKAFDPALLEEFLEVVVEADAEACKAQSEAAGVIDLQTELVKRRRAWQAA